jgi:agmatine deiminase
VSRLQAGTPRADGFRMPGEFEPHDGTWLLWPERTDNWRYGAKPAQHAFALVAQAIARRLAGSLYFPWDLDDQVAEKMLEIERLDRYDAPLVLEGGSIHVDGEGTLFTTEECLLNPDRNPHLSRGAIETLLGGYLGIEKVIWLGQGIFNDEINGHVDNLVAPLRPGVVALAWTDDTSDPQHAISRDAFERLSVARDARGRQLEIVRLHIPSPVLITREESAGVDRVNGTLPREAGDRMAASYVNFCFCNGGAVVPLFDDPRDQEALDLLHQLLPAGRKRR